MPVFNPDVGGDLVPPELYVPALPYRKKESTNHNDSYYETLCIHPSPLTTHPRTRYVL